MNIDKIISKSFKYVWKNRALWFFGFWLALFGGGFASNLGNSGFDGLSGMDPSDNPDLKMPQFTSEQIQLFIIIAIAVVAFLFIWGIIAAVIANWAQAALIKGANALENGEIIERKQLARTGKPVVWRLIVLNNLIPLAFFLAILTVIGFFCLALFLPQPTGLIVLIVLCVLLFLALIPFAVYFGVIWIIASRFVVLDNQKPIEAIKSSIIFIKGRFWWTFLLNIIYGIIGGLGSCAAGCLAFILALLPGALIVYLLTQKMWVGLAVVSMLFIPIFIAYLTAVGFFIAVKETGLTLWWREIKSVKEASEKIPAKD